MMSLPYRPILLWPFRPLFMRVCQHRLFASKPRRTKGKRLNAQSRATPSVPSEAKLAPKLSGSSSSVSTDPVPRLHSLPVYYASDVDTCTRLLQTHLFDGDRPLYSLVGFDSEWKPDAQSTALIQLCTGKACLLLHISRFLKHSPCPVLASLLIDQNIVKVGHGLGADVSHLAPYGLTLEGTVDTFRIATELRAQAFARGLRRFEFQNGVGLKALAQSLLPSLRNHEGMVNPYFSVQRSDWEAFPLSPDQINYASNDAYLALRVYEVLRVGMATLPPPAPVFVTGFGEIDKAEIVQIAIDATGELPIRVVRMPSSTKDSMQQAVWALSFDEAVSPSLMVSRLQKFTVRKMALVASLRARDVFRKSSNANSLKAKP